MAIRPRVLFLCTENSCRTQMAEALLREMTGDEFDIVSAGVRIQNFRIPCGIKANSCSAS